MVALPRTRQPTCSELFFFRLAKGSKLWVTVTITYLHLEALDKIDVALPPFAKLGNAHVLVKTIAVILKMPKKDQPYV